MANKIITHFDLDKEKLASFSPCMDNYDVGSPDAEWPNNIISRKAIVYQSGVIAHQDARVRHSVAAAELALCQRLSAQAETLMAGTEVGMGSDSSDPFHRFYIAANIDEPPPSNIHESLIRSKFGGTIFPLAAITIEPLRESGKWWAEVELDGSESGPGYFVPWKRMIEWFTTQPELIDTAFVRIGDSDALSSLGPDRSTLPKGTEAVGCVLPRLALGLTRKGSLAGLFGYTVQT